MSMIHMIVGSGRRANEQQKPIDRVEINMQRWCQIQTEIGRLQSRLNNLRILENTKTEILKQEKDHLVTLQIEFILSKLYFLKRRNDEFYKRIFEQKIETTKRGDSDCQLSS